MLRGDVRAADGLGNVKDVEGVLRQVDDELRTGRENRRHVQAKLADALCDHRQSRDAALARQRNGLMSHGFATVVPFRLDAGRREQREAFEAGGGVGRK